MSYFIALIWTIIAAVMTLHNTFRYPAQTLSGHMGLYIWNIMASLFYTATLIMFLALYFDVFQGDFLLPDYKDDEVP